MEEVDAWVRRQERLERAAPDAVCRLIISVSKKETNFQVTAKAFGIVQHVAEKVATVGASPPAPAALSTRTALCITPTLVEKLGDVKLKAAAADCLLALAAACTPAVVITQAIEVLEKQKSPKTLENGLLWMQDMCGGFALKLMKPKQMLDFVKQVLGFTCVAGTKVQILTPASTCWTRPSRCSRIPIPE